MVGLNEGGMTGSLPGATNVAGSTEIELQI